MRSTQLSPFDEKMRTEAECVFAILDRWDKKFNGHQVQKRAYPRVKLHSPVRLYDPALEGVSRSVDHGMTVYARDISANGIGFLYKGRIAATKIVLCLNPESDSATWLHAKIVRNRLVHNDFWEYGAQFTGRASAADVFGSVVDSPSA